MEIVFISMWAATLISVPIIMWVTGGKALKLIVSGGVFAQVLAVGVILWKGGGVSGLREMALIVPLAWLVEAVGSKTGVPFGNYSYTKILQPQLGGVPLLVPFAWAMMLPAAWGVSVLIVKKERIRAHNLFRIARAGVSALAFTAWDLFLDPQMVKWGFWTWDKPGCYFGIPLVNFAGWFFVSFTISYILMPDTFPAFPLFLVFIITCLFQSIALGFFWNLPGPALCGFLGMGANIIWALARRT